MLCIYMASFGGIIMYVALTKCKVLQHQGKQAFLQKCNCEEEQSPSIRRYITNYRNKGAPAPISLSV